MSFRSKGISVYLYLLRGFLQHAHIPFQAITLFPRFIRCDIWTCGCDGYSLSKEKSFASIQIHSGKRFQTIALNYYYNKRIEFFHVLSPLLELRNIKIDLVVNLIIGNIIPNIDNWCHGFGLIGANYYAVWNILYTVYVVIYIIYNTIQAEFYLLLS